MCEQERARLPTSSHGTTRECVDKYPDFEYIYICVSVCVRVLFQTHRSVSDLVRVWSLLGWIPSFRDALARRYSSYRVAAALADRRSNSKTAGEREREGDGIQFLCVCVCVSLLLGFGMMFLTASRLLDVVHQVLLKMDALQPSG